MGGSDLKFPIRDEACEQHGPYTSSCVHSGKVRDYWTGCPQCAEISRQAADVKRQQEFEEQQAAARQERLERNLQRVGIPARFQARTIENFEAEAEPQRKAQEVAREFVSGFDEALATGTTVVFSGRPGTGKSHLACAMATAIAKTGHTALYATAREIVLMLRDTWREGAARSERQMLDELIGIDIIVVDEVGVGFGTEAEKTQFFDVIDGRYREMMPTILLTNLDKKGLAEYIGQRAFDRLREGGIWVPFDWDSYRGRKS